MHSSIYANTNTKYRNNNAMQLHLFICILAIENFLQLNEFHFKIVRMAYAAAEIRNWGRVKKSKLQITTIWKEDEQRGTWMILLSLFFG